MSMNKVDLNCKVIQGEFGTFRTGEKLRHVGIKWVTQYIEFPEK